MIRDDGIGKHTVKRTSIPQEPQNRKAKTSVIGVVYTGGVQYAKENGPMLFTTMLFTIVHQCCSPQHVS